MIELPLSPTHTLLLDEVDRSALTGFKWRAQATDKKRERFYCMTWLIGRPVYLHRLILNAQKGQVVDHINGNGLDNRRKNLRLCSRSQNLQNNRGWSKRHQSHTVQHPIYKGVWKISRASKARTGRIWEAKLCWEGKQRYIGAFDLPELAAMAYDDWARCFHGRYARLNFPERGELGVHDA